MIFLPTVYLSFILFTTSILTMLGKGLQLKSTALLVFLLWLVKSLKKDRIVDHIEKYCLFSYFQYGFRSLQSTADVLTLVSDRIARAFNRSGTTRTVALDISRAFDRVWHVGLLHKLKSYGINFRLDTWPDSIFSQ